MGIDGKAGARGFLLDEGDGVEVVFVAEADVGGVPAGHSAVGGGRRQDADGAGVNRAVRAEDQHRLRPVIGHLLRHLEQRFDGAVRLLFAPLADLVHEYRRMGGDAGVDDSTHSSTSLSVAGGHGQSSLVGRRADVQVGAAVGATAVFLERVQVRLVADAGYDQRTAVGAVSVLAGVAEDVAQVDIMQALSVAESDGLLQRLYRRRWEMAEVVVGVEGGDVPGCLRAQARPLSSGRWRSTGHRRRSW